MLTFVAVVINSRQKARAFYSYKEKSSHQNETNCVSFAFIAATKILTLSSCKKSGTNGTLIFWENALNKNTSYLITTGSLVEATTREVALF